MLHLLGLEEGPARGKEELFGAWRLFFERMADQGPVALLFEDIQWADAALLEFVDYLLEWSRNRPIFVLVLARPELQSRTPSSATARIRRTSRLLRSPNRRWRSCSTGSCPAFRRSFASRILARAEGVPLYAVETVRMLLDRGLLVRGRRRLPAGG